MAKATCRLCDMEMWAFELSAHVFHDHLPYLMPDEFDFGGTECWCGDRFETLNEWRSHVAEVGGWRAHHAACSLGLHDGIDLDEFRTT